MTQHRTDPIPEPDAAAPRWRGVKQLAVFAIVGLALCLAAYQLAVSWSARHLAGSDDLEWLRMEFSLGDAEMARIRALHEGYLPRCQEFCTRIAAQKRELRAALQTATNVTPDLEQKLSEIAALRAQCQAAMLRHFVEVSRAMPAPQGRQYLIKMEQLTLGGHDQMEQRMGEAHSSHGSH
jgi:hypothetical protein